MGRGAERAYVFQSPSLRGSGRFLNSSDRSWPRPPVSIPFIAGQWSLRNAFPPEGGAIRFVSIPFIAGQWSLPFATSSRTTRTCRFQSPSLRGSGRFIPLRQSVQLLRQKFQSPSLRGSGRFPFELNLIEGAFAGFNPLHCGAVVASMLAVWRAWREGEFQSPSLRGSGRFRQHAMEERRAGRAFQSPSLRGSGRFIWIKIHSDCWFKFQSPSLRGSGRFK